MKHYTLSDVEKLVDKYSDIVDFGTKEDAVDEVWIERAEEVLGLQFTSSYKSFLKNYVGGEIGGDEIYSIYGVEYENILTGEIAYPGDIVYRHLINIRDGFAKPLQLEISWTDYGEKFYFNYSQFQEGECPIYLELPSGDSSYYASNFYEFLCNRIEAHSE